LLLVLLMSCLRNHGLNQIHGNLFHFSSKGFKILGLTFMSDTFYINFCVYCEWGVWIQSFACLHLVVSVLSKRLFLQWNVWLPFFNIGSHKVVQFCTRLKIFLTRLPSAGIIDMCHHIWLHFFI
jgi:hypothetical protein